MDDRAFERLFLGHYATLCEYVNSFLRAPDLSEEVVQTVFMNIWTHRARWQPQGGVRAYLFAACRNQAIDILRHERIVASSTREAASLPTRSPHADVQLETSDLIDKLGAVVTGLPERRRLVVLLRWQHQMTNQEIARRLGISVKGVEVQYSRALADLRRLLVVDRSLGHV